MGKCQHCGLSISSFCCFFFTLPGFWRVMRITASQGGLYVDRICRLVFSFPNTVRESVKFFLESTPSAVTPSDTQLLQLLSGETGFQTAPKTFFNTTGAWFSLGKHNVEEHYLFEVGAPLHTVPLWGRRWPELHSALFMERRLKPACSCSAADRCLVKTLQCRLYRLLL